jgi:hypothetical protein
MCGGTKRVVSVTLKEEDEGRAVKAAASQSEYSQLWQASFFTTHGTHPFKQK